MAEIIPLPYSHRTAFINRQAQRVAELHEPAAERYIAHQIKTQRDAMTRKGVVADIIDREMKCLEGSIRAALRNSLRTPGGIL